MVIIGVNNCSKCTNLMDSLKSKGISYTYVNFNQLTTEEKTHHMNLAMKKKIREFPLVIQNDVLLTKEEVADVIK